MSGLERKRELVEEPGSHGSEAESVCCEVKKERKGSEPTQFQEEQRTPQAGAKWVLGEGSRQ